MKKSKNTRSLWRYFISCLIVGFGITIPTELSLAFIANYFLDVEMSIPSLIWIVLVSIIIGAVVMGLISKRLILPLTKLSSAMNRVAEGDFETKIETESKMEAIQDIYTNFNLMTEELKATETLQTDFVSNVSHEIKTPINAIEGYTALLQSTENIDETENYYIEKILYNTKRLSSLVGNILLLSKVDNKAIQTKKSTYRLDEQIRQVIVLFEPKWSEKNIDFNLDMEEIEFTGDNSLLFHVWGNLISNAIKFSPENGLIKILLSEKSGNIIFTVHDEGCGIKPEDIKHIFNKFYQSDSSHKEEGNGLGLALVKNILQLFGGKITAENCESGGAKFTVTLSRS